MAELCPLLRVDSNIREGFPVDIPEVCKYQCDERMSEAGEGAGKWDDYLRGEPIPEGEVEYSHSAIALDSIRNRSRRQYRVVDQVTTPDGDWYEIGETTYFFDCPHTGSSDKN